MISDAQALKDLVRRLDEKEAEHRAKEERRKKATYVLKCETGVFDTKFTSLPRED